ncbi:MAG TPA: tripartite tricarboxylate transporter substrate binding protein [Hyphomicrobiaceae bacterium]|jgi:tripartite-type tricarboxylate transporter receptor subunit TctC|nr:tripartite tricarboxylate transporter substrate binding protein [Hyphomicrobiaceae bacterium]
MPRLLSATLAAMLAVVAYVAPAQAVFPERPIHIVIPFGPGGLADITMRHLGEKLTQRTGRQVVIENRPSAGGILAATAVTTATPDGYTLFVLSSGAAISRSMIKTMPYDAVAAFTPISTVAYFDLLVVAKADSPYRSFAEVLVAARAEPEKFNIGTIARGSTQNTAAELLRSATGVKMTIVAMRNTGEVATALLRGDVTVGIESYAAFKGQIVEGALRPIASSGDKRSPFLPNVPTLHESGVKAEVMGWNALVAPAGTPDDVIAALNGHVRAIVESPEFKARMEELGTEARSCAPHELWTRFKADIAMWADVIKQAGIEPK